MLAELQPVTINDVEFDALIEDSRTYEADVPSYPVENGYSISDSIILSPLTLDLTLVLTPTPVTWYERHGAGLSRVRDVIKQLEDLYFQKEPVTVVTPERTYQNMAILSFELSSSPDTGYTREIPISFQEIRITESATTTIPDSYGRSGKTGANAGTASTSAKSSVNSSAKADTGSNKTILRSIDSIGGDNGLFMKGLNVFG